MGKTSDKIFSLAGQVADAAVQTTFELVEKGRTKVDRYTLENNLKKAQRQLGIAVYTQCKTKQNNEAAVARWVEEIDKIRERLALMKDDEKDPLKVHQVCSNCGSGVDKDAMFCGGCGQELP